MLTGFDEFYGFVSGSEDYYTKIIDDALDLYDGNDYVNDTDILDSSLHTGKSTAYIYLSIHLSTLL